MEIKPIRIQRSRQHKQVSPNGLLIVYVGRGSRWGNPFVVVKLKDGNYSVTTRDVWYLGTKIMRDVGCFGVEYKNKNEAQYNAVECYVRYKLPYNHNGGSMMEFYQSLGEVDDIIMSLRGKNLSCWCKIIDENDNYCLCHADLLLSLANNKSIDEIRKENIKTIIR